VIVQGHSRRRKPTTRLVRSTAGTSPRGRQGPAFTEDNGTPTTARPRGIQHRPVRHPGGGETETGYVAFDVPSGARTSSTGHQLAGQPVATWSTRQTTVPGRTPQAAARAAPGRLGFRGRHVLAGPGMACKPPDRDAGRAGQPDRGASAEPASPQTQPSGARLNREAQVRYAATSPHRGGQDPLGRGQRKPRVECRPLWRRQLGDSRLRVKLPPRPSRPAGRGCPAPTASLVRSPAERMTRA